MQDAHTCNYYSQTTHLNLLIAVTLKLTAKLKGKKQDDHHNQAVLKALDRMIHHQIL